jgi:hypothetical protein
MFVVGSDKRSLIRVSSVAINHPGCRTQLALCVSARHADQREEKNPLCPVKNSVAHQNLTIGLVGQVTDCFLPAF